MEKNLIQKMADKLADFRYALGHSKMGKRVASLMLAGAMVVPVALSVSACTIIKNPDGSVTITPPPSEPGTQPGTDPGTQPGNQDDEPDLSQFSEILQSVLTSSYYADLYEIKKDSITLNNQQDGQNPFGYLKQEGYNLNDYFDEKLEIDSDVYFKGDDRTNLYIASRVESEHPQGNYYTCYVLQYQLTEQEYNDLKLLYENKLAQAPFFIQELTYQKQPVSVNKANIQKDTYNEMIKLVNNTYLNVFKNKNFELDFMGYDTEASINFSYTFVVRSAAYVGSGMIDQDAELRYLTVDTLSDVGGPKLYGDNVFYASHYILSGYPHNEEYEITQPITYLESDHVKVNHNEPWQFK